MPEGRVLGAVLAGGASRRMGTDKAALALGGRSLLERAVAALRPHCAEVVVVSARGDTPTGAWRTVADERPGLGPLAGLETALAEAGRRGCEAAVVLAVDLPLVEDDAVGALLAAWRGGPRSSSGGAPPHPPAQRTPAAHPRGEHPPAARPPGEHPAVAASRTGDPPFEPLCAVYPIGALPTVGRLLDAGERAARALFEAIGGRVVDGIGGAELNVNDPADLVRAEERLR